MMNRLFAILCIIAVMAAALTGCAPKAEEVPSTEAPKGAAQMSPNAAGGPTGANTQAAKPIAQ
jgi:ABC-type oligopeptide transport system substrate-binding subunit